ncbi:MAG: T9SS type A sorting domain-containing protein [candidate division WOR-3 bacterium]
MMLLIFALTIAGSEEPVVLPGHQAVETLMVDDGIPTGVSGLPLPGGVELVRLPVSQLGRINTLLYYPGRLLGFETPILHWIVFNDDGPGGLPGTPLGFGTATSLYYDSWYPVNVSSQYIMVNPGHVYVGWMTDTALNPLLWYQNWYDSARDGHNYTFSILDSAWVQDTLTPGDYMVRAILETIGVEEGASAGECPHVFPNPSVGTVNFVSGPGRPCFLSIYDAGGRLILEKEFAGWLSVELTQGVYVYCLGNRTGILTVR